MIMYIKSGLLNFYGQKSNFDLVSTCTLTYFLRVGSIIVKSPCSSQILIQDITSSISCSSSLVLSVSTIEFLKTVCCFCVISLASST